MTLEPKLIQRMQFLVRVVRKECQHLVLTDQRLFQDAFTVERVSQLATDLDLAERVEAFVGRFGRLQDTLGDKLLPLVLISMGERPTAVIDNLDRAERLGLIKSADDWLAMRNIRNQMVHEYVEDPLVLTTAMQSGHNFVPDLVAAAEAMVSEIARRNRI